MADLEKAIAYIQHHGTLVEQAQLRYVLTGSPVSPEICAAFLEDQHPDGSWSAFWAPHAASIDATCYHLIQAEYMGLLAPMHPALARAIMFLQQRQSVEGYWEEDVQLRDVAPPWAMPGELAATLYLTANCGFCLARLAGTKESGLAASAYLSRYLKDDGTLPSFVHTQWLAASLWYYLDQYEPAYRVFSSLQKRLAGDVSAGNLVWLIASLHDARVLMTHPLPVNALQLLEQKQKEDGRWESDDGPPFDVRTTLEAIRVLWFGK